MHKEDFLNITIRARFLFGLKCIKNAIDHFELNHLDWKLFFDFFLRYPMGPEIKNLALWHENEMECTPSCILEDKNYEDKEFEFLSKKEYQYFHQLYTKTNPSICELIDITAQVGTQNLYGGVRDGAIGNLDLIERIINICNENGIELPDINFFKKWTVIIPATDDWLVWGSMINKNDISQLNLGQNI